MVLFVADKIEWDQVGTPPYLQSIKSNLDKSIEHAALAYIKYLWSNKQNLKIVHPWLEEAYYDLSSKLKLIK